MKKIISLLTVFVLLASFAACAKAPEKTTGEPDTMEEMTVGIREIATEETLGMKDISAEEILSVYFSHNDGILDAAELIASEIGCESFRIETVEEYPDDDTELFNKAAEEHSKDVRPALVNNLPDLSAYKVIFVGFPVWDDTVPMAIRTFIEDHDMLGISVIPYCFSADGSAGSSLADLAEVCRLDKITGCYIFDQEKPDAEDFTNWFRTALYG